MGFRTLEISHAAEIYIKIGQLEITTQEGIVLISVEDLGKIMVHGTNIRLSTMDMIILSLNKVAFYVNSLNEQNVDYNESLAAKTILNFT